MGDEAVQGVVWLEAGSKELVQGVVKGFDGVGIYEV